MILGYQDDRLHRSEYSAFVNAFGERAFSKSVFPIYIHIQWTEYLLYRKCMNKKSLCADSVYFLFTLLNILSFHTFLCEIQTTFQNEHFIDFFNQFIYKSIVSQSPSQKILNFNFKIFQSPLISEVNSILFYNSYVLVSALFLQRAL